ncbi:amino acid adenylation domain-containing protein [Chengkuizengella marina]|uniref:Non-ribosomal peptide synthetase n=1 Tax=Chengkuizengella marina TaxID=2507566 RepID=A0A6N9Q817_9BACL|nr:non-ribosomal peptide synthetase [Chengkuizengella marina]NBI30764.1 non-ribosomal peptide synthetase [Chengkuizengella marina]
MNDIVRISNLTPMQEGMLFHSLYDQEGTNYREQFAFFIEGNVDTDVLKQSWQKVINRHEVFRTDFRWKESKVPIQIVLLEKPMEVYEEDITGLEEEAKESYIEKFKQIDLKKPMDFEQGKLNRISIIKIAQERYFICWTFHHILLDGWSVPIVISDFIKSFLIMRNGEPLPEKPNAQFGDYIEWLKQQDQETGLNFWREYLREFKEPTLITGEMGIKNGTIRKPEVVIEHLSEATTKELNLFCKQNQITPNIIIQSAFGVLLQRYNNTETSCFGMTVSGRPASLKNIEEAVGIFINTVPVVIKAEVGMSVLELLKKTADNMVKISDFEFISLADIKEVSKIKNSEDLFDSLILYQNYPAGEEVDQTQLGIEVKFDSSYELTNYDVTLVVGNREKMQFELVYNSDRISRLEAETMLIQLRIIIISMLSNPDINVQELELIEDREKANLLTLASGKEVPLQLERTISELFQEQVEKNPEAIAVSFAGRTMTYSELNIKANQLAHLLREKGVKRNIIVPVLCERSPEMIISILAVLKAGGAYVPLDIDYPAERIKFILKECDAKLFISTLPKKEVQSLRPESEVIYPENWRSDHSGQNSSENLVNVNCSSDLCYVIFTSGSTGNPKGVMIEHASVLNFINAMNRNGLVSVDDCILNITTISFDIAFLETILPLTIGARVLLMDREELYSSERLVSSIKSQGVTVLQTTPSVYLTLFKNVQASELKNVQKVLVGGEVFPESLYHQLKQIKSAKIFNMYGPTETTIWSTYKILSNDGLIDLGHPIDNTQVYVLDEKNELLPVGIPGEVCIAGRGLARGYLNNRELTESRFIVDPFNPSARMYKTGDLARRLSDGRLEFLGRMDDQVKIRGFRIEPAEIENSLRSHPAVNEVVVMGLEEDSESQFLTAYLVANNELSNEELRTFLMKRLPEYMIPGYFIQIEKVPLTPNGKIDRHALPKPNKNSKQVVYIAPRSLEEEQMAAIWKEVLKVERIGINDDFFDLGGHSLKAIQLIAQMNRALKTDFTLNEIFQYPTIMSLMDSKAQNNFKSAICLNKSNNPKNIFCIHGGGGAVSNYKVLAENLSHYNFYALQASGLVDEKYLHKSVEEMVRGYLKEIRYLQKTGPYVLMGYSFGSYIAYEMAYELYLQGEKVEKLILIDSPPFDKEILINPETMLHEMMLEMVRDSGILGNEFEKMSVDEILQNIYTNKQYRNLEPFKSVPFTEVNKIKSVIKANLIISQGLQLRSNENLLTSDIYYIKAHRTNSRGDWQQWTTGKVNNFEVVGDHSSILQLPDVRAVAQLIDELIKGSIIKKPVV